MLYRQMTNHHGLKESRRVSPKEHFCKIVGQIVWEEKVFKVFPKANIRLTAPPPDSHILRPINMAWWNLIERIIHGTFLQNYLKIGQILSLEKIF